MNGDPEPDPPPPVDPTEPNVIEGAEPVEAAPPPTVPGQVDTLKIDVSAIHGLVQGPPPPRPKPPVEGHRTDDGGWQTEGLRLRRAGDDFYLTVAGNDRTQVIHLTHAQLEALYALAEGTPGELWRKLSSYPLERPRPSRALEEELRVLMSTFATELRQRR
jgi:hypothetical protein